MHAPLEAAEAPSREAYARLEKRLTRERGARLEAEAIAEKGLRELWTQQRELLLISSIARTTNHAKTSRQALGAALQEVCEFTQWPVGHVYFTRSGRHGRFMEPTDLWCGAGAAEFQAFRRASESLRLFRGEGLPGRVLTSGKPAWSSPLQADPRFPRKDIALETGLRSGLAFPVLVGERVAAALEFFTSQVLEPDEDLLDIIAKVGEHLGRSIEREQAEAKLKAKNRKLSEVLRQADEQRRQAEAANRAKTTFLAVTSHEVRTPLNAVLGLAEGLRRQPLSGPQVSLVEGIIDSGSMLLRLLNAVLELSRIESGEVRLSEGDCELGGLLSSVVRLWRGRAEELDVRLELDVSALPSPCEVRTDRGKLEQVLTNLISNALKFTPPGGCVAVRASGRELGDRVQVDLSVADGGPGVPDEDKLRIFEPYAQTEAGRAAGGAGLGLTICAGHVQLMGGAIRVEDAPAGGAVVRVELELARGRPEAQTPQPASEAPTDGLRVLVAEDNEPNRRVLQVLLEPAGVDLVFTENGAEALDAFQRQPFDLVLMDVNMPVMSGVEAVRAIRSLPAPRSRTPIHMLTANAFEADVQTYLAAGADGVLAKPVQVQALYAVIADVAAALEAATPQELVA